MGKILSTILFAMMIMFGSMIEESTAFVNPSVSSKVALINTGVRSSSTSLNVFGNKKSKAQKEAEAEKASMYWQGDWVCKDCGYIYNRGECAGMYFEEQGPGFRCPQCSGPRRRYAKKGGDAPILLFSFGGVALTIAFGVWAVNNL